MHNAFVALILVFTLLNLAPTIIKATKALYISMDELNALNTSTGIKLRRVKQ